MKKKIARGIALIACGMVLVSCLKQKDETDKGPKARIAIVNAALDSEPLSLLLDGAEVNPEGISFGNASGNADNAYLPASPGIRTTAWKSGSFVPAEQKFLNWKPGGYYTLIHFDTAFNNFSSWIIVEDKPEPSDTVAKARFINCVAGTDSLSIWLVNPADTVELASRQLYLGRTGTVSTTFDKKVDPGAWRYELFSGRGNKLAEGDLGLFAGTMYSIIATGETGGTGAKAPGVLVLSQRKN